MDLEAKRIELLLEADPDDLFELIAGTLTSEQLGASPSVDRAKKWYEEKKGEIREKFCSTQLVRVLTESPRNMDRVVLVAAIADLIAVVVGAPPATTVAALIVKEGVQNFCAVHI